MAIINNSSKYVTGMSAFILEATICCYLLKVTNPNQMVKMISKKKKTLTKVGVPTYVQLYIHTNNREFHCCKIK